MLDVFDIEGYKKVERLNKYPMAMPRSKMILFLNLNKKPNLPSQESGMSFLFSSTAKPDFDAYLAYQKKIKMDADRQITMNNKELNILNKFSLI